MSWMVDGVGRLLARYLEKPVQGYEPFTPSDPDALRATLQPGDVLLVEGNNHISGVIKYLTQSKSKRTSDKASSPRLCQNMPASTPVSAVRRSSMTKIAHASAPMQPSELASTTT